MTEVDKGEGKIVTKPKINTMEELSAAIGVSRPTLSRYFQDPDSVRRSTGEKIRAALEGVEYVPNFFATRMNRKMSGLIGVIIPHLNDLFFTSLLNVIEIAAQEAGFTVITQSSHGDPEMEARAAERLLSMNADGAIVGPLGADSNVVALGRLGANLPFIFVDSRLPQSLPNIDFVGTDNRQSIGIMTEYLCRKSEAPVFLGMPRLNSNSEEREAAYLSAMARLGRVPRVIESAIKPEGWAFEAYAYQVMTEQFGRGHFAGDTLICANDRLAIGALRAANRHGLFARDLEPRQSIRIAGHDDHPLSRFMTPSLTTVAQDVDAIGRCAVDVLVRRIHGGAATAEGPEIRMFDANLRVRESA